MAKDKDKEKEAAKPAGGRRKAAAFLLSIDSELASKVMQRMSERDVALISDEMTRITDITGKEVEDTLTEYSVTIGG
ncbi:MAG: hypothetical protein H0X38_10730, partial [Planctomycetes bacterium]|nr:hypothetical protein [Planctomycetota bacterium]